MFEFSFCIKLYLNNKENVEINRFLNPRVTFEVYVFILP